MKLLFKIIADLPPKTKTILFICFGLFSASLLPSIAVLFWSIGSINYSSQETQIVVEGKKIANDSQYSNKQLSLRVEILEKQMNDLQIVAKNNPEQLPQKIEEVEQSFNTEFIPTAKEAITKSSKLNEIVENAAKNN